MQDLLSTNYLNAAKAFQIGMKSLYRVIVHAFYQLLNWRHSYETLRTCARGLAIN